MAKKNSRSNASDTGVSSPAQPKAGGRGTRRSEPGTTEALVTRQTEALVPTQDTVHQTPTGMTRQEMADDIAQESQGDVSQGFSPAAGYEPSESAQAEPSEEQIRLRAYLRYLERGAGHGADFDDWLQAEMELKKR